MSDPPIFTTTTSTSTSLPPPPPSAHHHEEQQQHIPKNARRSGVFFQLLDWNRRFNAKRLLSHRLLPAERSCKHSTSQAYKDDKLPMAKLLLIADENRGGFPKAIQGSTDAEETLAREKTPEKKKKSKRTPNVVAKLMGLEAMPSPEPRKDKEKFDQRNVDENTDPNPQSFAQLPDEKTLSMRNPRALAYQKSDELRSPMFFCKLPALSPRKTDYPFRSILSPSKTHNRLLSPIKSPLGTKRLFEAAVKILEPSMQPSCRVRNLGVNSRSSKFMLADGDREEKKSGATQISRVPPSSRKKLSTGASESRKQQQGISSRLYPDPSKVQKVMKQDKKYSNMFNSSAMHRLQVESSYRQGSPVSDLPGKSGTLKEESIPSNTLSHSHRHVHNKKTTCDSREMKTVKDEKPKAVARKHQNGTRPAGGSKNKVSRSNQGAEVVPKGRTLVLDAADAVPGMTHSNNHDGDGSRRRTTDSVVTAHSASSNSSILNYGRLFRSHKSSDVTECNKKKEDSSLMKSLLRKRGGSTETSAKREPRKVASKSSKQVKEIDVSVSTTSLGNESSCILENSSDEREDSSPGNMEISSTTHSIDLSSASEISTETAVSSVSTFSSSNCGHKIVTNPYIQHKFVEISESACITENSLQSSCISFVGDCVDSASSNSSSEVGHINKKAVSYSGKTTAAILQELLMALNSSKTPIALENRLQRFSDNSDFLSSADDMLTQAVSAEFCSGSHSRGMSSFDGYSVSSDEIPRNMKRLSSPISTLEPPFEDDSVSESINNSGQESVSHKILHSSNQFEFDSRRHNMDASSMGLSSKFVTDASLFGAHECEKQYVKEIMGSAKLSPINVYAALLRLPCTIIDPAMFRNLEDKYRRLWKWGIAQEANSSNQFNEAGAQNRKLIFDCVNEALCSNLGIDLQQPQQAFPEFLSLSPVYHSKSVCRQIHEWREMGCSMNVDDLVEKQMTEGVGKWIDFSYEVSFLTLEMEAGIIEGLIEEIVYDLNTYLRNYDELPEKLR